MTGENYSLPVQGYEEVEHPSDIGLRFWGSRIEELFANAGVGMFSLITDLERVESLKRIELDLKLGASKLEELLILWLEKLLYYFEVENMLFSEIEVEKISARKKYTVLRAVLSGEEIDNKKHSIIFSIKAPTYHMLDVSRKGKSGLWQGTVIFDV